MMPSLITKNPFKFFSLAGIGVWLGLFALTPLLLVLITSLLTPDPIHFVRLHITFTNYTQLAGDTYLRILLQSVYLALNTTLVCLLIGYPFAFFIARTKSRFKVILLLLVIIPFWTSSLIRSFAIMTLLKTKGLLNTILITLGVIHHPLQILYSYDAVLIGAVYTLLPFMILPLYANIEKLDGRLIEAARDLGANRLRIFFRIILPLTEPGIIAGVILVFLPAMTLFYIPVILGGAKDMMLGNLILSQFLIENNWPMGAATSVVLIGLVLVSIAIYWRKSHERGIDTLT